MNIPDNPAVTAVILALIAAIPSTLVWLHSRKVDAVAEETGSIAQVMAGLNNIIELTRADNTEMRKRLGVLDELLAEKVAALAECTADRRDLKAQLAALEIRYGIKP